MKCNYLKASLSLSALLWLGGCGMGQSEDEVAGSGDPEADQRAELRVGGGDKKSDPKENATLFERLGGNDGIRRLVDDMSTRVLNDPRVNFDRQGVRHGILQRKVDTWDASQPNIDRFKERMVEFIALAAGGPAEYRGQDIRSVHKNMEITNGQFDAMIGDIKTSMDRLNIAKREQKELLAIFETTRKEIVEKGD